jgi:hypothetical protein
MSLEYRTSKTITTVLPWIGAIFLLSRLALWLVAHLAQAHLGSDLPFTGWTNLLCRWDCGWYLGIASHGYSTASETPTGTTSYAFYPLLPVATGILAPVFGGNPLVAGLVFTNACFFAALAYVYSYARLLKFDHTVALTAVTLMCVLPLSIAFSAVLT